MRILLLLLLLSTACTNAAPVKLAGQPPTVRLVEKDYRIVRHALSARTCKTFVLGLGGGDTSYAATMKELLAQVPSDLGTDFQLVNLVQDSHTEWYLFAWKR